MGDPGQAFHDLACTISGAVIDGDHFVVVVVEGEQLSERLLNVVFFIARGNDDRNAGIAGGRNGIPIPLGGCDIGHAGHAECGIDDARKPGQRENGSGNPVKVNHSRLGRPCQP